jgi:hypothetical protein
LFVRYETGFNKVPVKIWLRVHHRNPEEKYFQLGNQITNRKWEVVLNEVDKCDLICANCHFLEHIEKF